MAKLETKIKEKGGKLNQDGCRNAKDESNAKAPNEADSVCSSCNHIYKSKKSRNENPISEKCKMGLFSGDVLITRTFGTHCHVVIEQLNIVTQCCRLSHYQRR